MADNQKKIEYTAKRAELKKERDELRETIERLQIREQHLSQHMSELDREYMESLEQSKG